MEVFDCNYCDFSLFSVEMRAKHHAWHARKGDDFKESCRLLDCHSCEKSFPTEKRLRLHAKFQHPEVPSPFHCPDCSVSFSTATLRDAHIKTHFVSQFFCRFCTRLFSRFSSLANHVSQVHWRETGLMEPPPEMPEKKKRWRDRKILNQKLECHYCDLCFNSKYMLWKHHSEHKRADHEVKPSLRLFDCGHCSKWFASKAVLAAHVRLDHVGVASPSKKDLKCRYCDLTLGSLVSWYRHHTDHKKNGDQLREEDLTKPVICKYCDISFPNKGVVAAHVRNQHTELPRPHVCSTCGSGFLNEAARVAHKKLHTVDIRASDRTEFEFACRFCPSGFDKFQKLAAHVRHVHYRETGLKHPQHC